jgi:hypothetical protein
MTMNGGSFRYPRHFFVLICLTAVLAAANRWLPVHGLLARFGMYGALYSFSLAVAVRAAAPAWRRLEFIALGALLSLSNAIIGIEASHIQSVLQGAFGPSLIVASCAALGAAAYTVLVRKVWKVALSPMALMSTTLCCTLAVLGMLAMHLAMRADGVWLAASWWFAFSLGLWYHDGLKRSEGPTRPAIVAGG